MVAHIKVNFQWKLEFDEINEKHFWGFFALCVQNAE